MDRRGSPFPRRSSGRRTHPRRSFGQPCPSSPDFPHDSRRDHLFLCHVYVRVLSLGLSCRASWAAGVLTCLVVDVGGFLISRAVAEGGEQARRFPAARPQELSLNSTTFSTATPSRTAPERKRRTECQKRAVAKPSSYGASGAPRAKCAGTGYGMRPPSAPVALTDSPTTGLRDHGQRDRRVP